jgi:hypothetical protein
VRVVSDFLVLRKKYSFLGGKEKIHIFNLNQIRSVREWYRWIGRVRAFLAIYFFFHLDFLNGVQNSTALHVEIYLITNIFGGRQA